MKKATFNNVISLEYPEDFKELSDEENKQYFSGELLRISFHNKERHILLSLSKSRDSFLNRLIGLKTALNGALSNLENNLDEFQFIEEYETTIFDKSAITGCFSYTANDVKIGQYGELSIFKIKSTIYAIYCVSRLEDKEESKKIFKQFKDSITSIN